MANKEPTTRVINYPAKFKPLLDRELEERGFFSYTELMGQILAQHYGLTKNENSQPTIIEGRKING